MLWTEQFCQWENLVDHFRLPYWIRKSGTVVVLCPFHADRTPSLRCWQQSRRFKCHGCLAEGDMRKFVELIMGSLTEKEFDNFFRSVPRKIKDSRQLSFAFEYPDLN